LEYTFSVKISVLCEIHIFILDLGPFYLTKLLLPTPIATAKSSLDGKVQVINTSSSLHLLSNLNYNTLKDGPARRKWLSLLLYCQSKYVGNIPQFYLVI